MSAASPAFSAATQADEAKPRLGRDEARAEGRRRKAEKEKELAAQLALAAKEGPPAAPVVPARKGRGDRDLLDGTGEYRLVAIDELHEDPDNPRRTYRKIAELAASLKADGMLQPIVARITPGGKLIVQYGHRRLRAAKVANWQHVPVIIRYGIKDSSVLARQLQENSHRDDLDPIEEARGLRRYMQEQGIHTQMKAAEKLGHSLTWVSNRMALLDLDGGTQDQVTSGTLSIVDAVARSRRQTGNTRARRPSRAEVTPPYFDREHFLAGRARGRCKTTHGIKLPGGIACGECWEAIIRIDALTDR